MNNKENNFQPSKKKAKVAKQKKQVLSERFQKPKSDEEMKRSRRVMCRLIHRRTLFGLWQFFGNGSWLETGTVLSTNVPRICLRMLKPVKINHWASHSIREVQRKDGQPYPPRIIHQILAGLQRFMLSEKPDAPQFLDRKDPWFRDIHGTCDTIYRESHQQGIAQKYNMQLLLW